MAASSTPVALEDLIVLNDEILALTRAGVPLEPGLAKLGSELPHGPGELAGEWAERLAAGGTLEAFIAPHEGGVPGVYRAVLAAGLRSGRLPAVLEGLASTARQVMELRQLVGTSLLYPLLVLVLAYLLMLFFAAAVLPTLAEMYRVMRIEPDGWFRAIAGVADLLLALHVWPVLAVLLVAMLWWMLSGRAMALEPGWADRWIAWLPGVGGLLTASRLAAFTEVFALLVEHRVPLPEALELSGDVAGEGPLKDAAREAAGRIRQGQLSGPVPEGLPPLLGWILLGGGSQADVVRALRYAAETYRRQARDRAQWLRLYLPLLLLLAIGGTATALYALLALSPWFSLLYRLGDGVRA